MFVPVASQPSRECRRLLKGRAGLPMVSGPSVRFAEGDPEFTALVVPPGAMACQHMQRVLGLWATVSVNGEGVDGNHFSGR